MLARGGLMNEIQKEKSSRGRKGAMPTRPPLGRCAPPRPSLCKPLASPPARVTRSRECQRAETMGRAGLLNEIHKIRLKEEAEKAAKSHARVAKADQAPPPPPPPPPPSSSGPGGGDLSP